MKIKKMVRSLLMIALIFGGLGTMAPQANARHVRSYQIHSHLHSHRRYHQTSRHQRPIRRRYFNYRRDRFHSHRLKLIDQHQRRRHINHVHRHFTIKRIIIKYRRKRRKVLKKLNHRKRLVKIIKLPRPSNRAFKILNNHARYLKNATWEAWGKHHREIIRSYSGPKVTFKTLRFLPLHLHNIHLVQSITVTPSGRFAFLGCDTYPYLSGYTRIIKVNLRKRHGGIKVGPQFKGGHGQALAYNSKNNQLWLLADHYGPMKHGSFDEISTHSLRPIHKTNFKLRHEDLGNVLTFDNSGNIYNEDHIRKRMVTKQFKKGSLVFYKGKLSPHRLTLSRIDQGLRRSPGFVIQEMAYNRRTRRLYLETDEAIMSLPINKLGNLKKRDVKETLLHGHREYEGLSFDRSGHAYIVLARPNEILRSTNVF